MLHYLLQRYGPVEMEASMVCRTLESMMQVRESKGFMRTHDMQFNSKRVVRQCSKGFEAAPSKRFGPKERIILCACFYGGIGR